MNLAGENKQNAIDIFDKMLYSSEAKYNELYNQMKEIGNDALTRYFDDNWHNVRQNWAGYSMNDQLHFFNRTTNRNECLNQKLKSVLDRYAPISKFFKNTLLCINSLNVEKDVRTFMKNERLPLQINDPEYLKPFRKHLTAFAFDKMQTELNDIENVVFDEIRGDGLGIINYGNVTIICDMFKCNCNDSAIERKGRL